MTTRLLTWVCFTVFLSLCLVEGKAVVKRDADFLDVRTKLDKDRSGKKGDSKEKYFRRDFRLRLDVCSANLPFPIDEST